jgi:hypothetical protein
VTRRDKDSKPKRECCEKPLRKACKRCPRRFGAGSEGSSGRPGGLPPCVAELLRR